MIKFTRKKEVRDLLKEETPMCSLNAWVFFLEQFALYHKLWLFSALQIIAHGDSLK